MHHAALAILVSLLLAPAGAWAACPATPGDCPSSTMNNLTIGGQLFGADVTPKDGNTARELSELVNDGGFSVLSAGAKCDGTTSDRDIIQGLINQANAKPVYRKLLIPAGRACYIGAGIVIIANSFVALEGGDFQAGIGVPVSARLVCDANTPACVRIEGPTGGNISNLVVQTNATVKPTAGACIMSQNAGRRITTTNVWAYNCYDGFYWGVNSIGIYMNTNYTGGIAHDHIVADSTPEIYIAGGGRYGNGANPWSSTNSECFFRAKGGNANPAANPQGVFVTGVQMQGDWLRWFCFTNKNAGAVDPSLTGYHVTNSTMEQSIPMTSLFYSDGSWTNLQRMSITGSYINAGSATVFEFAPATSMFEWQIANNSLFNAATLTLDINGRVELYMANQPLDAVIDINSHAGSSSLSLIGNKIQQAVTLSGPWQALTLAGGTITGPLTTTAATGPVTIDVPGYPLRHSNNAFIGGPAHAFPAQPQVSLHLQAAPGQAPLLGFMSGDIRRWDIAKSAAENFGIDRYDATGVFQGAVIGWSQANGSTIISGPFRLTPTNNVVAAAGGGQASATAILTDLAIIGTVATANDSVKLKPTSTDTTGNCVQITNRAVNSAQVFGESPDTINGVATATGVALPGGKTGRWCSVAAGAWYGGTLN